MTSISTNLEELTWIPRPRLLALRRLGIETTEDLLTHFPRRHEDRTEFPQFPREETDSPICLCGEVIKTSVRRFGGWKKIFEATLEESQPNALSEPLVCRWFNLHYVQKMIATGQRLVVFGKPRMRGKRICMDHPEFEVIENDEEISIHFRRITPVYPATEGLSQRVLRGMIYRVLHEFPESGWHPIAPNTLVAGERSDAIRAIHFPATWGARDAAREHLVLSEFFAMQMLITSRRFDASARAGQAHCGAGALLDTFLKALPFALTAAQAKVISEIRRDLAATNPMNRLLQGDVGSGKTVVAIAAMLLVVEAGYQAAFMAPTQILAEQHYEVLRRWLEPLSVQIALRTAARQEASGPLPLFAATENPGSARPQRAGDGILPSRTFIEAESTSGAHHSRRRLPHFEKPWSIYAVTITTAHRRSLDPQARNIVLNAWRRFHNARYELFAFCVMPDHVHALFQPWPKNEASHEEMTFWSLTELMRSLKSFTAREINRAERKTGAVWEKETFDRYIRSDRDLAEKFHCILRNPWDAGVAKQNDEYPWIWTADDETRASRSSSPPNAATSTLQACAPQTLPTPNGPHIIVGTHALLYENVSFSNLGVAVIDEQHKFGVAQRARLTAREPAPDVLVMTATPIPRTLTMTIYGDLDVSTIDEMPRNR
jgi:REP element-mobilizing transposase RayT